MSKKIISAILVMAMVISMSATALLSSVGAAAETDYEADRATLKASIQNLVTYGPTLEDDTMDLLKKTGILTWDGDNSRYVEEHNRNEFWKNYTTETFGIEDFLFVKTGADRAAAIDAIDEVVKSAAAAYYFGKEANDTLVDATFNAGRNEIVKNAIKSINGVIDTLKAEVGSGEAKPAGYAALYKSVDFKGFATESKAYNQSIGFNPYLYIISEDDYNNDNFWGAALGQYVVRWYTFAEARELDANGVFAFEKAIREVALYDGAKVLFVDFVGAEGKYTEFTKIVKDLFANLVGDVKDEFGAAADVDAQIKAFLKLEIIIDLYDLYIKDVYNNIYTASAAELLNDVLYAKRVIEYVKAENTNTKLLTLIMVDFDALTNDILAGIKAVAPRSEQLLSADDITNGTALVRKAEALLANWANWASNDDYKGIYGELNTAKNNLKNMIPNAVGSSVLVITAADSYKMKNIAGTEIFNDKVVVEFTPNWFAFVKFSALLEAEIKDFTNAITNKDTTIGAIDLGKNDLAALASILNKYAFLAGIVGDVVEVKDDKIVAKALNVDASALYASYVFESPVFEACSEAANANAFIQAILACRSGNDVGGRDDEVKSLYEYVVGTKFGDTNDNPEYGVIWNDKNEDGYLNKDAALDNAYYFVDLYEEILRYALANNFPTTGSFDWTAESWKFETEISKKIETLESAIKNLTKDLTVEIQTYAWILWNVAEVMDWDLTAWKNVRDDQGNMTGVISGILGSDGKDWELTSVEFDNFVANFSNAYEALKLDAELDRFVIESKDVNIYVADRNIAVEIDEINEIKDAIKAVLAVEYDLRITKITVENILKTAGLLDEINDVLSALDGIVADVNADANAQLDDHLFDIDNGADSQAQNIIDEFVAELNVTLAAKVSAYVADINDKINSVLNKLEKDINNNVNDWAKAQLEKFDAIHWTYTADAACYTNANNYPKDYMSNTLKAANGLAQYLAEYLGTWNKDGWTGNTKAANAANLVAAYDKFVETFKANILTDDGAAKFDKFVEDTYYVAEAALKGSDYKTFWNNYDLLLSKFQASNVTLDKYLADAKNCYEYFALTLKHVADCDKYFVNLYNKDTGALNANLIAPLADLVKELNVVDYTRDWAADYQAKRELASYVYAAISGSEIASDMPLWYAERVFAETKAAYAEKDNYTTKKLVEYKAGLEALLIEADGLNVYNYVSNTDEAKAIWADFVDAYTNAQYIALDTRCEFAKVDEAVAALTAAMAELEKIEAAEGASTVDTLNAKIAAAEALLARADVVDMAEEAELVLAINAAKKALQFNISVLNSTDLDELIKSLNDLMVVIEKEMYTGADLKKAAKVLELQVVVDLYTEASYRKFANAVEAAYAMAEEDTATESAMMAAYANVEARFGDLKLAPVEEEPEVVEPEVSVVMTEAIEIYNNAANGYDKAVEGCTAESAAAYNAAINTLKADIEANADDAKLLESIIALNLAKAALTVDVPETCDC